MIGEKRERPYAEKTKEERGREIHRLYIQIRKENRKRERRDKTK